MAFRMLLNKPSRFMTATAIAGTMYIIWMIIADQTLQIPNFHYDPYNNPETEIQSINQSIDFIGKNGRTYIQFVEQLLNQKTDETHTCSPHTFKYLKLMYESLKQHRKGSGKLSSADLNSVPQQGSMLRLRIINGTLYAAPNTPASRGGHFMYLSYFHRLLLKYGKYVPNTDFIFGWVDGSTYKQKAISWYLQNKPFFISEGCSPQEEENVYPLYLISRGWLISHHTPRDSWWAECLNRNNVNQFTQWENKINMLEFRGANNGNVRLKYIRKIVDKYGINNDSYGYNVAFTAKLENEKYKAHSLNNTSEIKYKHRLVIDGISVRDGFHKQSLYGGVIYKDVSINNEWWYYDLVDNETVLYYKNVDDLMKIVDENIHAVKQWEDHKNTLYKEKYFHLKDIATNHYKWYKDNLWNPVNVDCFVIHMLQLYNEYLFDASTVEIGNYEKYCFSSECKHHNNKHYQKEIKGSRLCEFDDITDTFCPFC